MKLHFIKLQKREYESLSPKAWIYVHHTTLFKTEQVARCFFVEWRERLMSSKPNLVVLDEKRTEIIPLDNIIDIYLVSIDQSVKKR